MKQFILTGIKNSKYLKKIYSGINVQFLARAHDKQQLYLKHSETVSNKLHALPQHTCIS